MEYADNSNEEMASLFIISTCQLLQRPVFCVADHMHSLLMSSKLVPTTYMITCGSAADFYIRPLNTCIGDADYLRSEVDQLAFIETFPVLPTDLSGLVDTITCYQIQSYEKHPGFVRILVLGEILYNWTDKKYGSNYRPTATTNHFISPDLASFGDLSSIVCGPAIKSETYSNFDLGIDRVISIFCPKWPTEANNWPIRPRKSGWPTSDTISEVIQNGCHVVYSQHRSCRDDTLQWRLSFSFAEMILLHSFSLTQQIVYHLLRYFAKRELIEKDCPKDDEILCTYHLKTLMLWACEEMPLEWWVSSSVFAICSELLKKLLEWLKRKFCPNYFIPDANLFHNPSSSTILEMAERRISEFCNSSILCHWFVESYILPVIQSYFKVETTIHFMPHFLDYLLPILRIREELALESLDFMFLIRFKHSYQVCRNILNYGVSNGLLYTSPDNCTTLTVKSERQRRFGVMPTIENELCFKYFDSLLFVLHLAHSFNCGEVYLDSGLFVELIKKISMHPKIIRSLYHNFPRTRTVHSGRFQFLRALDLMQNLTESNSQSEFQLVFIISTEYFRKALEHDDSQFNGIGRAALSYLAALHFASSEYKRAIRFCLTVLTDQTHQERKETLNVGCLLFIDDVARIFGLCLLNKKINDINLNYIGRRLYLDLRLSPNVFAYYLNASSAERISNRFNFYDDLPESGFPMDDYLNYLLKQKYHVSMRSVRPTHFKAAQQIIYHRVDSLTETRTANMNPLMVRKAVIDFLLEIAFENVVLFYDILCKDFTIKCNTADCYRALYLYKCRQYKELLNLCERILQEPDLGSDLNNFSFAKVLTAPPLDCLFDLDIQSLLGFHKLYYHLSPLNVDVHKARDAYSKFKEGFPENKTGFFAIELSQVNKECNRIDSEYFLGRHFLARYLRVRGFIGCNLPYKKALTEFAAQKTSLPLEVLIHGFLLQKIRRAL